MYANTLLELAIASPFASVCMPPTPTPKTPEEAESQSQGPKGMGQGPTFLLAKHPKGSKGLATPKVLPTKGLAPQGHCKRHEGPKEPSVAVQSRGPAPMGKGRGAPTFSQVGGTLHGSRGELLSSCHAMDPTNIGVHHKDEPMFVRDPKGCLRVVSTPPRLSLGGYVGWSYNPQNHLRLLEGAPQR